jgi:SAM-dependent methyltransferase
VATIAALLGHDAPDPATARVLEIGCGDGGNLVPMAAALAGRELRGHRPRAARDRRGARCSRARSAFATVAFHDADLRDLPAGDGPFDYVVAHGFYSWVPAPVREAMFETFRAASRRAALAFVSHNVLPGCGLRRMVWDVLKPHVAGIEDPAARIAEARAMAARDGGGNGASQPGVASTIAVEFRDIADRPGFGLLYDDIAPGQPSGARARPHRRGRRRTASNGSATRTCSATRPPRSARR